MANMLYRTVQSTALVPKQILSPNARRISWTIFRAGDGGGTLVLGASRGAVASVITTTDVENAAALRIITVGVDANHVSFNRSQHGDAVGLPVWANCSGDWLIGVVETVE